MQMLQFLHSLAFAAHIGANTALRNVPQFPRFSQSATPVAQPIAFSAKAGDFWLESATMSGRIDSEIFPPGCPVQASLGRGSFTGGWASTSDTTWEGNPAIPDLEPDPQPSHFVLEPGPSPPITWKSRCYLQDNLDL